MNHSNILCKSVFISCDFSVSVSVSRIESKNCERRFFWFSLLIIEMIMVGIQKIFHQCLILKNKFVDN